jgi:site-specific recombinase XerD
MGPETLPVPIDRADRQLVARGWQIPPVSRHPVITYLGRLGSPHSVRAMRARLEAVAALASGGRDDAMSLAWPRLEYQHTQRLRALVADRWSPATANLTMTAVRQTLRECWRLGYMTAEEYHRSADIAPVRGERLPAGRALPANELRALFAACRADASPAGARDGAMLAAMYGCALRRSEVVALDLPDYDAETGALKVRHAKGNKQRVVFVPAGGGMTALAAWLEIRGDTPGPLFWPVSQTGELIPRRLTAQVARWVLRKRAAEAGITSLPSPHDLRRTSIGDLLDAGADLSLAQRIAGHSSPTTTGRYDRRPDQAKRKAASLLHIPY